MKCKKMNDENVGKISLCPRLPFENCTTSEQAKHKRELMSKASKKRMSASALFKGKRNGMGTFHERIPWRV